jgi:serine/threonine protein kinase
MARDPFGIVGKLLRVTTGEYAVRRLVAEGGFGLVYEAEWLDRRRRVALKVLKVDEAIAGGYDGEARARFEQEARLLVELHHPAIIELLAFDHLKIQGDPGAHAASDGSAAPFLVLEWIEGETLDARVAESGPFSPSAVLTLLAPVADAISLAHSRGVIHRDLKPANLLLGRAIDSLDRPEVPIRVLDFGVARWASPNAVRTTTTSKTGLSIGYAAPEQYGKEFGPVDGRADQFALAAIVYFALTGVAPFAGTSLTEVLFATCASAERPSLARHRLDLAGPLDDVLRKALAIRPDDRYPTVEAFFAALDETVRVLPPATIDVATDKAPPVFSDVGASPPVVTLPSPLLLTPGSQAASALPFAHTTRADAPAPRATPAPSPRSHGDPAASPRTRPTGGPPSRPVSEAPSAPASRASTGGRLLLFLALGGAAAAVAYAALPWFQESGSHAGPGGAPSTKPSTSVRPKGTAGSALSASGSTSASASASASSSSAPLESCGELGKDESCIGGGSLHRGPDDCSQRGSEPDHRAVCPTQTVDVPTFVLDRREVTHARYAACVSAGKCAELAVTGDAPELPARGVRWSDAAAFCKFDHGKRLPTDDEWELAAAGIEGRIYPWGNTRASGTLAIYAGDGDRRDGPSPVGSVPAGATGDYVLDLAGNVAEWTATSATATAPAPPDPQPELLDDATVAASKARRWVRGGSYRSTWDLLRSWSREAYAETLRSPAIGFRCARSVPRPRGQ